MADLKYYNREIYSLFLHDNGVSLDDFLRATKKSMIKKFADNFNVESAVKVIKIEFTVQSPSESIIYDEVQQYQRADGQYVYRGDFTPREVIQEKVKEVVKVVVMTVYLEEV